MHEQPMTVTEASLRRTVEAARVGDPDAWEALYRRAYPRLFAYARRRLATDEQAEDAVSESMTRAMQRIAAFTWTPAGVDGWLFGIARNVVLETYRGGSRTTATDPQVLAAQTGGRQAAAGPASDPAEQVLAAEERRLVRLAFDRLTAGDQEVLELRVVAGLGSEAVAALTGRRPGAVRMAQSRALQRLRGEYEGLAR
jgi:RNA polymerase sigma-70 factor (ECF subfamily)